MDREEGYGEDENGTAPSTSNGAAASNGHAAAAGGSGAAAGSFAAAAAGGASTSAPARPSAAAGGRSQEVLSVTVTEVVDATEFFVQVSAREENGEEEQGCGEAEGGGSRRAYVDCGNGEAPRVRASQEVRRSLV
jgi:hypothetical protein